MKRIIWNVRRESDLIFYCIGYMEVKERFVWKEVIRIPYLKRENLKYHLYISGMLIDKYNQCEEARNVAELICLKTI